MAPWEDVGALVKASSAGKLHPRGSLLGDSAYASAEEWRRPTLHDDFNVSSSSFDDRRRAKRLHIMQTIIDHTGEPHKCRRCSTLDKRLTSDRKRYFQEIEHLRRALNKLLDTCAALMSDKAFFALRDSLQLTVRFLTDFTPDGEQSDQPGSSNAATRPVTPASNMPTVRDTEQDILRLEDEVHKLERENSQLQKELRKLGVTDARLGSRMKAIQSVEVQTDAVLPGVGGGGHGISLSWDDLRPSDSNPGSPGPSSPGRLLSPSGGAAAAGSRQRLGGSRRDSTNSYLDSDDDTSNGVSSGRTTRKTSAKRKKGSKSEKSESTLERDLTRAKDELDHLRRRLTTMEKQLVEEKAKSAAAVAAAKAAAEEGSSSKARRGSTSGATSSASNYPTANFPHGSSTGGFGSTGFSAAASAAASAGAAGGATAADGSPARQASAGSAPDSNTGAGMRGSRASTASSIRANRGRSSSLPLVEPESIQADRHAETFPGGWQAAGSAEAAGGAEGGAAGEQAAGSQQDMAVVHARPAKPVMVDKCVGGGPEPLQPDPPRCQGRAVQQKPSQPELNKTGTTFMRSLRSEPALGFSGSGGAGAPAASGVESSSSSNKAAVAGSVASGASAAGSTLKASASNASVASHGGGGAAARKLRTVAAAAALAAGGKSSKPPLLGQGSTSLLDMAASSSLNTFSGSLAGSTTAPQVPLQSSSSLGTQSWREAEPYLLQVWEQHPDTHKKPSDKELVRLGALTPAPPLVGISNSQVGISGN